MPFLHLLPFVSLLLLYLLAPPHSQLSTLNYSPLRQNKAKTRAKRSIGKRCCDGLSRREKYRGNHWEIWPDPPPKAP